MYRCVRQFGPFNREDSNKGYCNPSAQWGMVEPSRIRVFITMLRNLLRDDAVTTDLSNEAICQARKCTSVLHLSISSTGDRCSSPSAGSP
jgi:hypothetical protein